MNARQAKSDLPESPYDRFARAYDTLFAPEAAEASLAVLNHLLFSQLPENSQVLDLCCGSGRLTRALVDHGHRVLAVDSSSQMLACARERVPEAEFLRADIRHLHLDRHFDAVICAYNSIPHITVPADLGRVFSAIARSLRPAGRFIFDLFSDDAYRDHWRGSFAKVADDCVCVVRASYDPATRRGQNMITIFQEQGAWERADVTLVTRAYTAPELRVWLRAAGFSAVECVVAQGDHGSTAPMGRVFWSCRKC